MKKCRTDCFSIVMPEDVVNGKITCRALGKIDCENCSFYKKKDEVKDNIFYKDSYEDPDKYKEDTLAYKKKFGLNNLDALDD